MKSILGLIAGLAAGIGVAAAYVYSVRPNASWFDAQWLFIAALPYNWTMLKIFGESSFAPDVPSQIIAALLFSAALAYVAGAAAEAIVRLAFRAVSRLRRPA